MNLFGGDWTEEKLDCVSAYLGAYMTALKGRGFHLNYIDAFAGTGYRELKRDDDPNCLLFDDMVDEEPERFRKGSVMRALEVSPRFNHYYFIEIDPAKCVELQGICAACTGLPYTVANTDANSYLHDLVTRRIEWRSSRAVIFLDPFGTEVGWPTLDTISRQPGIDLWYLFPAMAVNRMLKQDGQIPALWRLKLDSLFGTNAWYERFYTSYQQQSLWGEPVTTIQKQAPIALIKEYLLERLRTLFPYVASNPLVLCNSRNTPLFILCFAITNPSEPAVKLAKKMGEHILGKHGAKLYRGNCIG